MGNSLSSTIPESVSNLRALTHLDLESNALTGSIPGEKIGTNLDNLTYLFLGKNRFDSDQAPVEFRSLTSLRELSLDGINLQGAIPNWLSELTDLKLLDLRNNNLTGSLDGIDFSKLSALSFLLLNDNNLTGSIPEDALAALNELTVIALHHNDLAGKASTLCPADSSTNVEV